MPPEKMIPLVSPPPGGETKGGWSPLWMPLDACASLGVWTGDAGGDDAPGRRGRGKAGTVLRTAVPTQIPNSKFLIPNSSFLISTEKSIPHNRTGDALFLSRERLILESIKNKTCVLFL